MQKIVFVLPDMRGGGSERVVAMLANEFTNRGYEVAILLFAGNQTIYPLDKRIEVAVVGEVSGGNLLIRLKRIWKMRQYYKKNKGCYIFAFSVMGAVFSVFAAMGIPHRMLVSERNDPQRYEHRKIRDWAYRKAEKLVFQTEDVVGCFSDDIRKKAVVIPNPIADNMLSLYEGERKKCVVSVARLQPQKNHKLLIDAFADFLVDYPDYELDIFGVGELENELKCQAESLGIKNKVIFKGFSSNVTQEIWKSKMFVLSSDYEGISNSMVEALSIGVPVISTDCPVGGSRMFINNGINGLLVPVGDRQAMTDAMKRIASDDDFARKLSVNGIKIREKYGLKKIANMFLEEAGLK